jgi:hypothetical protein
MVGLDALIVPIVVSAVAVFIVSSLIHMVIQWHKSDYRGLAKESAVADALRASNVEPGIYNLPYCASMKEMGTPEMAAKLKNGPVAMIVVRPNGMPAMGKFLGLWFVYCLLMSLFAAYLAGRTLAVGAPDLVVVRFVGTIAFVGYGLANMVDSIWKGFPWSVTFKYVFDGLLYSLATAAVFCWLWPR